MTCYMANINRSSYEKNIHRARKKVTRMQDRLDKQVMMDEKDTDDDRKTWHTKKTRIWIEKQVTRSDEQLFCLLSIF
jgi:hypothetical protein